MSTILRVTDNTITHVEIHEDSKDGAVDVPCLRTLGTGSTQAAAGDHTHGGGGVSDGDKGDVTVSGSGATWTIDNGAVTNAKRADMAAATISGRASGAGTGAPTDLTATQVKTLLAIAASDVSGLATVATSGSAADLGSGTLPLARLSGITDTEIAAANKDGAAGTASLRTLGTGSAQAAAGNHDHAATYQPLDATLTALAGVGTAADKLPYSTGVDTFAEATFPAIARTLLAAASTPEQRIALRTQRVERTEWLISNNSSALATVGCASPSTTGTPSAVTLATTSVYTMQRRLYMGSAGTAGSSAGLRMGASLCFALGDAARKGGFLMVFKFGVEDASAVANARTFVGLTSSTSVIGNVEPGSLTNIIGVGCNMADANLSVIYNDNSGTATKTSLGANFPANTLSTDWYELILYAAPSSSSVWYQLTNVTSGNTTSNTLSSDLPSGTTMLGPQFWRNNGSTASAVRLGIGGWLAEVGE